MGLPGRSRLDVGGVGPREATPVAQGVGGQLGAVVAADVLGGPAPGAHEPVEDRDGRVGVDSPVALDRERLARVLVDDVQELQDPPVGGLIELEVERQTWSGRSAQKPIGGDGRLSEALALAAPSRDAQALLTPDPLHPRTAHAIDLGAPPVRKIPTNYRSASGGGRSMTPRLPDCPMTPR